MACGCAGLTLTAGPGVETGAQLSTQIHRADNRSSRKTQRARRRRSNVNAPSATPMIHGTGLTGPPALARPTLQPPLEVSLAAAAVGSTGAGCRQMPSAVSHSSPAEHGRLASQFAVQKGAGVFGFVTHA